MWRLLLVFAIWAWVMLGVGFLFTPPIWVLWISTLSWPLVMWLWVGRRPKHP
jgi:hypothetical protein